MSGLPALLALGFGLGLRHAADSDHVAAVGALVARERRLGTAWLLGAAWGFGHSAALLAAGAAIILFKLAIPERAGPVLEACVGVVLVAVGALNLAGRGPLRSVAHSHVHEHGDHDHSHDHETAGPHVHLHVHAGAWSRIQERARGAGGPALLRSLGVGLVHGLAGSGAAALLVLSLIPDPRAATIYLVVFAAGTLAGMLSLSAVMELVLVRLGKAWLPARRWAPAATGLLSIGSGLAILWASYSQSGLKTTLWITR